MLDANNLAKYTKEQVNGVLNNLKAGRRLYSIIAFIFILLTVAFAIASIISICVYHFDNDLIAYYLTWGFFALFFACLIVMMAMIITIKFKYSDPIEIVERFKKEQEKNG